MLPSDFLTADFFVKVRMEGSDTLKEGVPVLRFRVTVLLAPFRAVSVSVLRSWFLRTATLITLVSSLAELEMVTVQVPSAFHLMVRLIFFPSLYLFPQEQETMPVSEIS